MKQFLKKEKNLENKANREFVGLEEKVGFNKKYAYGFGAIVTLGVLALFLILYLVPGIM